MSNKNKRLRGIVWLYDDGTSEFHTVTPNPKPDSIVGLFLDTVRSRLRRGKKYSPS